MGEFNGYLIKYMAVTYYWSCSVVYNLIEFLTFDALRYFVYLLFSLLSVLLNIFEPMHKVITIQRLIIISTMQSQAYTPYTLRVDWSYCSEDILR